MPDVAILTLRDSSGCRGDSCGCGVADQPRVPVLQCTDALRGAGFSVEVVTACSDAEIDDALKPVEAGDTRLIMAAATDAEVRAVVRRLVRRYAPPPSKRPADLPDDRTIFDLPALAVLPLMPSVPGLVGVLDLPRTPTDVALAVGAGRERRLDLLRHDGGSVTLGGVLLRGPGSTDGSPTGWRGRVEVDDAVLSDGHETVLACAIRNAGPSDVDGVPLVVDGDPVDGLVEVAVAVPVLRRRLLREATARVEVRRARGRAASVIPRAVELAYTDDGVATTLDRKRSWWTERGAWATYVM